MISPVTSPKIVLDMTTTRPEFFRNLKVALRDMSFTIDGDNIRAITDDTTVKLNLTSVPPLALGPTLKLERWQVTIEFNGQSKEQRQAFMKTFERAFHRGGG